MTNEKRNFKEPDFMRDLEEILRVSKSALDNIVELDTCKELREELQIAYDNAYSAYYEAVKYDYAISDIVLASAFYALGCKNGEFIRTGIHVEQMQHKIQSSREKNRNKSPMTPARKDEKEIINVIEKYLNSPRAKKYTQEDGVQELELQDIEVSPSSFSRWIKIYRKNGKSIFTTKAR